MPMITPALRRAQAAAPSTSLAASSSTTATLAPQSLPALPRIPLTPTTLSQITTPIKKISSEADVESWKASTTYSIYTLFLQRVCEACVGKATQLPSRVTSAPTTPVERLVQLLYTLDSWTDEIEPQAKPQRFGNLAFRDWGARLAQRIDELHTELLPERLLPYAEELKAYLGDAFGSFTRIDYGSGHELAFFAWVGFLYRLGFFDTSSTTKEDLEVVEVEEAIGLRIFPLYLMVVWRLQDRYGLEPAGSHGVWGLDDFQFLPYVLGAAQLRTQSTLRPAQIVPASSHPSILTDQLGGQKDAATLISTPLTLPPSLLVNIDNAQDTLVTPNLYLTSLLRIQTLKRGPFHEHSPLLNDIATSVPNWLKVYAGMLKMYAAECLGKKVVVQHFPFGGVGWVWHEQPNSSSSATATAAMSRPAATGTAAGGGGGGGVGGMAAGMALGGMQGNLGSMGVPTARVTRMPPTGNLPEYSVMRGTGAGGSAARLGHALGSMARATQTSRPTAAAATAPSNATPQAATATSSDRIVPPLPPTTRPPRPE